MTFSIVLGAAALLSVERIVYLWIWYKPEAFRRCCQRSRLKRLGGPVDVLKALFVAFKLVQAAVFLGWCLYFGAGEPVTTTLYSWPVGAGVLLLALGQLLNWSVFSLLGKNGVFYGNRFGYDVEWRHEFPFSVFDHPQYAGALLSIWGFFLIMRFPHDDWYWLPLLETVYYATGAYWERDVGENDEPATSSQTPSQDCR